MLSRYREGQVYLLPLLCYILLYKNLNPHHSVSKTAGVEMDSQASDFFRASFSFHHRIANDPGPVWIPVRYILGALIIGVKWLWCRPAVIMLYPSTFCSTVGIALNQLIEQSIY